MPGDRPEHRVTQAEGAGGAAPARPKNLGFMVGWLVFLGIYQILLAWKFGTFFEGSKGICGTTSAAPRWSRCTPPSEWWP